MSMMDSFIPQEDLLAETSENKEAVVTPSIATLPIATSPVVPSDLEDNENEEIRRICSEENRESSCHAATDPAAEPVISLT
jgi:hypothetical protein